MYHEGDGGTVSYEHAMFWLKRAAAEGFNDALQALQEMKSTCVFRAASAVLKAN